MKDDNKGSYAMIAIVAIVAIVGIVVMFMGNKNALSTKQTDELVSVYDSEGNQVGQVMASDLSSWFRNGGWSEQGAYYEGYGGSGGGGSGCSWKCTGGGACSGIVNRAKCDANADDGCAWECV